MSALNESVVEEAALTWFAELGYAVGHGPHIAPCEPAAERDSFGDVVLIGRLREAIRRLNPAVPEEARDEAVRKVLRVATTSLVQTNRAFHRMLRDGIDVEYPRPDGSIKGDKARLVDFADVVANDWLVVNQFTVIEAQHNRRPDLVVFVNGLPLVLIELKNAADEDATIWSAYAQLQTYKAEVPSLLHYNAALVVSDGLEARMGSLTANQEWFKVWRTIEGEGDAPKTALELEVLVRGVFDRRRFLDLLQHFIVFEEDADTGALNKIIAGYHQFHAVNAAVEETVRASGLNDPGVQRQDTGRYWAGRMHDGKPGDRRAGVVWHTQGSGKSFTMLFFAARVIRESAMQNPTLVVLTDRNDLDDQLFGQFQRCHDILGQMPVQAGSREHLAELLTRASGGVVFTTIQKFMNEGGGQMAALSRRANIVVIADEAHRSQYGFGGKVNEKGEMSYGFASNLRDALPNASFIGFTGTDEATAIRDDVSFFQALQAALNKKSGESKKSPEQIDAAIRQLVSRAITTEREIIDVFTAAGLKKPDIGILSPQFLAEVRGLKHKNVAAELLEKLLKDELRVPAGLAGRGSENRSDAGRTALGNVGNRVSTGRAGSSALLCRTARLEYQATSHLPLRDGRRPGQSADRAVPEPGTRALEDRRMKPSLAPNHRRVLDQSAALRYDRIKTKFDPVACTRLRP